MQKEVTQLLDELELDLQFSVVELEDVTALPETAASSGSTSCSASSTCGSSSCSTCT
ncbi:thiazolylpeptide-type bacteriocin [Streptococcus sp. H31]|uniref:thiazolylpeptide-type bacteriocin n=1 Tax=Streptococcus huangxiaojuni TaxID=3237239 RepID=UPI0009ECE8FB